MRMNLVMGIGNLILGDDAIGPIAARELKKKMEHSGLDIDFKEYCNCGIDLLDEISGYKKVIIIDSINDKNLESGLCMKFSMEDLCAYEDKKFTGTHGINLPTVWKLGEKLGVPLPGECLVFGIVGHDFNFFYENLSEKINAVFIGIIDDLKDEALRWFK